MLNSFWTSLQQANETAVCAHSLSCMYTDRLYNGYEVSNLVHTVFYDHAHDVHTLS